MAIMNPREVLDRVRTFPLRSFALGEPVISQATATGLLLFLNEGAVDIALEDTFIARVAEPGAVFGELAFLLGQPHTATVTAVQPSSFYVVAEPEALLEAEPKVAIYVARVLAGRLNAANHLLVEARRRVDDTDQQDLLADTLDRVSRALQTHGPR